MSFPSCCWVNLVTLRLQEVIIIFVKLKPDIHLCNIMVRSLFVNSIVAGIYKFYYKLQKYCVKILIEMLS